MRGLARVSFLHMLLEAGAGTLFQWDAYRSRRRESRTRSGTNSEARKLDFDAADLGSSLLKALSTTDKGVRRGIHATASQLMINLGKRWDYFGNPENYVPLGPPKIHPGAFRECGGIVGRIEKRKHLFGTPQEPGREEAAQWAT